ncbi:MAG: hypothetical protein ACLFU6_09635 [Candidatus Hydrogenedentota bacterium]
MNPLLRSQIERLNTAVSGLEATTERLAESAQRHAHEKQTLKQQLWRAEREKNTYRRAQEDYDALQAAYQRTTERRQEAKRDLERVLERTKTLASYLGL